MVDARIEFDDGPLFAGQPNVAYLWNPIEDDGLPKPVDYWQRTLSFVLPLLAQPKRKIYLHCAAGVNGWRQAPVRSLHNRMATFFLGRSVLGTGAVSR